MISVKVKAIMELAEVLGQRELVVSLPEESQVSDLLDTLITNYGQRVSGIFNRDEQSVIRPNLVYLLNGRNILFLDGFKTRIRNGDELFFLPPVGGG